MKVILIEPQIPQNTGNIVRTCAVAGCDLILVKPAFPTSDRHLRRAGLDYWEGVNVSIVDDIESLINSSISSCHFFSSKATTPYSDVTYGPDALLIFGSETTGLPPHWRSKWEERYTTLPMRPGARCLNLATSVGIAVYEAWRQQKFR